MEFEYFDCVEAILQKVRFSEAANMCAGVDLLEKCVMDHGSIYIFGASHAGILSQEMFYRAGGLMLINPIFGKEVSVEASPITLTSDMERLVGYGTALAKHRADFQIGDVLIAHSVSGRNPVTIEVAQAAKDAGASVIALTNLSYSKTVSSRHPSGKRLFELADVVVDNHGDIGDAAVPINGLQQKVGPRRSGTGGPHVQQGGRRAGPGGARRGHERPRGERDGGVPRVHRARLGGREAAALLHRRAPEG